MTIRVTLGMLNSQFVRNLNQNLARTETLQNQLASGKIINAPSDDPVGITFSMRYRSEIAANEQFKRNLDAGVSFLENLDVTLEQLTNLAQRARELTVQAASDSNSQQSRDSIAAEIEQLLSQAIDIGNTNYNGKYMFNGQLIDIKPYDTTVQEAHLATTDTAYMEYEVGVNVRVPVNLSGNEVFGEAGQDSNLFLVLSNLSQAIRSSDTTKINRQLGQIDVRLDKILESRAIVGARANRLEFVSTRLDDIDLNLNKLQSKTEDANMGELITTMKMNESVYQASLATGAKIIQPSLVDFLR